MKTETIAPIFFALVLTATATAVWQGRSALLDDELDGDCLAWFMEIYKLPEERIGLEIYAALSEVRTRETADYFAYVLTHPQAQQHVMGMQLGKAFGRECVKHGRTIREAVQALDFEALQRGRVY